MRLIIVVCLLLVGCATPEGNERMRRVLASLRETNQRNMQTISENAASNRAYEAPQRKPVQVCATNCQSKGNSYLDCFKHCEEMLR